MKPFASAAFLFVVAVLLVACGSKSVVGDWTVSIQGVQADANFSSDGKLKMVADVAGSSISQEGTYKLEGENLTLTVTSIDLGAIPPELRPMIEAATKEQLNKPQTGKLTWNDDGSFSMASQQGTLTFTPKK